MKPPAFTIPLLGWIFALAWSLLFWIVLIEVVISVYRQVAT